jgi:hypothetical protein
MPRFAVCSFLDPQTEGATFRASEIPLHVTIVGNFRYGEAVSELIDRLGRAAEELPVTALTGGDVGFGPNADLPVVILDDSEEIDRMHRNLLSALMLLDIHIETPEYSGSGFRAHITRTPGWDAAAGEWIRLDSVSLIELDVEHDPRQHRVVATRYTA